MSVSLRPGPVRLGVLLYLVLRLPPATHVLAGGMTLQMLVQIPLLVAAGYLLRDAVPRRFAAIAGRWNHQGVSGLVLATLSGMFWMLPRSLDAATIEPWMAAAKFISVPLLVGLPMGLSWPRMGFIVRGVFLLELIATFYRLGWLYLVSPERLCNNFLLDDQQRSGRYMLVTGTIVLLYVAGKLMWGRFDPVEQQDEADGTLPHIPPT
jgi:hypothetical protein